MPMVITEETARADLESEATEIAEVTMKLQRRFLLNLSEELARGNVSFPQFFLLGCQRAAGHVGQAVTVIRIQQ